MAKERTAAAQLAMALRALVAECEAANTVYHASKRLDADTATAKHNNRVREVYAQLGILVDVWREGNAEQDR